jgi:hypothetical protein
MDLVLNFKPLLKAPLLAFFQSVTATSQTNILTKDSVYTAMGLCAAAIHQEFDFNGFLTSTLVNDVQQTGAGYKVLRRSIAILIARWISIQIAEDNRPLVYQIFQHLLNAQDETNDQVVRMTAVRQLHVVLKLSYFFHSQQTSSVISCGSSRMSALLRQKWLFWKQSE